MMHEKRVEIRWHDVDAYRHVNNAVFLTYLEEARDEWLEQVLGRSDELWDFVLGRVEIDYRQELTQEDDVVIVRCSLASVGNSSVRTTEQILKLDGNVSAEAKAVLGRWTGSPRSRGLSAHRREPRFRLRATPVRASCRVHLHVLL